MQKYQAPNNIKYKNQENRTNYEEKFNQPSYYTYDRISTQRI